MAQLNQANFLSKWAALFADNTTGDISALDQRDFRQDISDSFINILDHFIDEDSFASDSATKVPSQQSTKAFVLAQLLANTNGINWKTSVKAATTANITLSGAQTIDGISCVATDRVLVKNQTTLSQNGIYVVAAGAWTRATDMDVTAEFQNAVVSVDQGTTNADTSWRQATDNVSVGTSNVVWAAFASNVVYSATAAGTNTYTATLSPAITAYSSFQLYLIRFTNANTAAATLNLNSLGAKDIRKNGSTALASGDISAGQIYMICYDGTNMQILGKIADSTTLASGTYTPTLSNTTNVAASTAFACQYMRVGNTVTVSGTVTIDPTSAGAATLLGISLPIASNFTAQEQCAGVAYKSNLDGDQVGGAIIADTTNNRAELALYPIVATLKQYFFTFTYTIL
jgi:hypothetical protein